MSFYELDPSLDMSDSGWIPDPLHGLVYCPGTINLKPVQRITPDELSHDFNINAAGAFRMISASLKKLKAASGASIVLFSTVAVQTGMPYHVSVAAAKGAVEGMARSLAAELASSQIRVNVIAPSLTDTPLASPLLSTPEKKEAAAKRHPLGRFGNPADIASAALFLLSGQSSWITGQIIGVDGGMSTLRPL
jgi:NAD(P)-dependent dehydrogenase (short-subunit alcohol dehydrogenase family)